MKHLDQIFLAKISPLAWSWPLNYFPDRRVDAVGSELQFRLHGLFPPRSEPSCVVWLSLSVRERASGERMERVHGIGRFDERLADMRRVLRLAEKPDEVAGVLAGAKHTEVMEVLRRETERKQKARGTDAHASRIGKLRKALLAYLDPRPRPSSFSYGLFEASGRNRWPVLERLVLELLAVVDPSSLPRPDDRPILGCGTTLGPERRSQLARAEFVRSRLWIPPTLAAEWKGELSHVLRSGRQAGHRPTRRWNWKPEYNWRMDALGVSVPARRALLRAAALPRS